MTLSPVKILAANEKAGVEWRPERVAGSHMQSPCRDRHGGLPELLKVADVQTHICAKFLSICSKLVFLNPKQEKQVLFYDFGTI